MIADGLRRGACTRSARMRALAVYARAHVSPCRCAVVHVLPKQTSGAHGLCVSPSGAAGTVGAFGRREIREWPFAGVSHSTVVSGVLCNRVQHGLERRVSAVRAAIFACLPHAREYGQGR